MPPLPPLTRSLLIALLAVFVLQWIPGIGPMVEGYGELWPVQSGQFWPWQLVTYAFLHSRTDMGHLFFNMLGLFMFGVELERIWGQKRYAQFLLASTIAAGLTQILLSTLLGNFAPTIGASGAVYGLLIANAMLFPRRQMLLFMVYPTSMTTAVIIFGVLELVFGIMGQGGVAHFAHLGGLLGGALVLLAWRAGRPRA